MTRLCIKISRLATLPIFALNYAIKWEKITKKKKDYTVMCF